MASMKTREEAERAAKRTLAQMKSKGWKIQVWENLGWHYCLVNAFAALYPSSSGGKYYVLLSDSQPPLGGCGFWHTDDRVAFQADPNEAVAVAVEVAVRFVEKVAMVVETMEGILHPRWARMPAKGRRAKKLAREKEVLS